MTADSCEFYILEKVNLLVGLCGEVRIGNNVRCERCVEVCGEYTFVPSLF